MPLQPLVYYKELQNCPRGKFSVWAVCFIKSLDDPSSRPILNLPGADAVQAVLVKRKLSPTFSL